VIDLHREAEHRKVLARRFDSASVGAGAAGCVVARRRLDRTDATVLALEAGGSGAGGASLANPPQWGENSGASSPAGRPLEGSAGGRACS
jgi:choline dehydrogenase-like flavoprotein